MRELTFYLFPHSFPAKTCAWRSKVDSGLFGLVSPIHNTNDRKSKKHVFGNPAGQFYPLDLAIRILRQKRKKGYFPFSSKISFFIIDYICVETLLRPYSIRSNCSFLSIQVIYEKWEKDNTLFSFSAQSSPVGQIRISRFSR
jgi:hypothetical protein